jgi:hypothetical protein
MSCPYANILGEPNTGIHSIRIFGYSVVDFFLTAIAAVLTAEAYKINVVLSFAAWFILGEVLHYIFGVKSAFLKTINLTPNCR